MEPRTCTEAADNRREFLKKCGRFAVVTPPAVTFMLSTSMSSKAIAQSAGRPGHGFGDKNHDHWGPPGLSTKGSNKASNKAGNKGRSGK